MRELSCRWKFIGMRHTGLRLLIPIWDFEYIIRNIEVLIPEAYFPSTHSLYGYFV